MTRSRYCSPGPARMMRGVMVVFFLWFVFCWPMAGGRADTETPVPGRVKMLLRTPGGDPLSHAAVRVFPPDRRRTSDGEESPSFAGHTDGHGALEFDWEAGLRRLRVVASGVGFGSTGHVEVNPGETNRVRLPPLAPFGSIEGTLAPEVVGPDTIVICRAGRFGPDRPGDAWTYPEARCDEQGRFLLRDVTPGDKTVVVKGGKYITPQPTLRVVPGERSSVQIRPRIPLHKPLTSARSGRFYRAQERKSSVRGQVVREDGAPAGGVRVWGVSHYHHGIRMHEEVRSAVTDEKGRFALDDLPGYPRRLFLVGGKPSHVQWERPEDGGLFLVARERGYLPAFDPDPSHVPPETEEAARGPRRYQSTLVLPGEGADLRVRVTKGGAPFQGAWVRLRPEYDECSLYARTYVAADHGDAADALAAVLYPSARTDENGEVLFESLVPGRYHVMAADVENARRRRFLRRRFFLGNEPSHGIAWRVPVRKGTENTLTLPLLRRTSELRFRIRRTDATIIPADRGRLRIGGGYPIPARNRSKERKPGVRIYAVGAGMRPIRFPHVESQHRRRSWKTEPHSLGQALLAVSSLVKRKDVVDITTVRREAGAVEVELRDPRGNPAPGVVIRSRQRDDPPRAAASTDEKGRVVFTDLPSRTYSFHAYLRDAPSAPLVSMKTKDQELTGKTIVPREKIEVSFDTTSRFVLRAREAGYVRGRVVADQEEDATRYRLQVAGPAARLDYDSTTREFICGPLAPGRATLILKRQEKRFAYYLAKKAEVDVAPGGVTQVEITPVPKDRQRSLDPDRWKSTRGVVLLSDGKTPAFGARVAWFKPEVFGPVAGDRCGPRGRFDLHGLSYTPPPEPDRPYAEENPTGPVLVAWLPGRCGATIMPIRKRPDGEVKIVLPPGMSLEGTVTVAGGSPHGFPARFRVLAEHLGRGKLRQVLNVSALCEPDGSFTLRGLTPGIYRVQAAMDDIWVSESVRVEVKDGSPEPIVLDIPTPGGPATVKLEDEQGSALADVEVRVDLPAGPLTRKLRSHTLRTDGAGIVRLEGLGAGEHTLWGREFRGKHMFRVPPLGQTPGQQRTISVTKRRDSAE